MSELRRLVAMLAIAVATCVLTASPTSAGQPLECSFGDGIVSVTAAGYSTTVKRIDDAIAVDGLACGEATVTNTDEIDISATGSDQIAIDVYFGALAPGATDEGDGSSEIEIHVTGEPDELMIWGTAGSDAIVAGSRFEQEGQLGHLFAEVNLNADETVHDADVVIEADSLTTVMTLVGDRGDDHLSASGWLDEPISVTLLPTVIRAGPDDDRLVPGSGVDSSYDGGNGSDTFDVSWLDADCLVVIFLSDLTGEVDSRPGCHLADVAFAVEDVARVQGHPGMDVFIGGTDDERLSGAGGDDLFVWSRGTDMLRGGPGADRIEFWPAAVGVDADLDAGTAHVGAHDATLIGVEELSGGDHADVLDGDEGRNVLFGGGGVDRILGRSADDWLLGGPGNDELYGGLGIDACSEEPIRKGCELAI